MGKSKKKKKTVKKKGRNDQTIVEEAIKKGRVPYEAIAENHQISKEQVVSLVEQGIFKAQDIGLSGGRFVKAVSDISYKTFETGLMGADVIKEAVSLEDKDDEIVFREIRRILDLDKDALIGVHKKDEEGLFAHYKQMDGIIHALDTQNVVQIGFGVRVLEENQKERVEPDHLKEIGKN